MAGVAGSNPARPTSVLIIAEKRDAAERIAIALDSDYKAFNVSGVKIYRIRFEDKDATILPARGHIFGLNSDVKNRRIYPVTDLEWEPLSSINKKYLDTGGIAELATRLLRDAEQIIIACDYDIEGETIGYNIVKYCGSIDKKLYRAKFSTLTSEDLRQSFGSLIKREKWNMAEAGRTRHYIDYLWGINLSRLVSDEVRHIRYANLSTGRVQGPTLLELYRREFDINAFVPRPYWQTVAQVNINGEEISMAGPTVYSQNDSVNIKKLEGKSGSVELAKSYVERIPPPPPFNLAEVQKEAYRILKMSPWKTLSILESLYLKAAISYPRTSSQKLPASINYKKILGKLAVSYREAGSTRRGIPAEGRMTDSAHPAIYPTGEGRVVTQDERSVYDLVARRFISCFMDDVVARKKMLRVNVEGVRFTAEGLEIISRGWVNVYHFKELSEVKLPDTKEGDKAIISKVNISSKYTKPPPRYNPSSLLEWMEKNNIGTKATRSEIIRTLYKRNYVDGQRMQLTNLGYGVTRFFINSPIITVEMTRNLEISLEKIEDGSMDPEKVMLQSINLLFEEIQKRREGEELSEYFKLYLRGEKIANFGKCPVCGVGDLIFHRSVNGKRFLRCEKCGASAPMPARGLITPTKTACKSCGWPLMRRGRWVFCPNPACPGKKK
ncbi:MAG: DNA topoisomerase I [Nitrososphaerota archaeon]|nr:DNA topoisomerase I [Nitrososphaerota archaeon]